MSLYTAKGDDGTTGLFGSKERISKTSPVTEALGTLDELNAVIGVCRAKYRDQNIAVDNVTVPEILFTIQQDLFVIQAQLAGADKHISQEKVDWLSGLTDTIEQQLEPITSFLLPGASELSSFVDLARTVARRSERRLVEVVEQNLVVLDSETLAYANRLSSVLYALVRLTNDILGGAETAPTY